MLKQNEIIYQIFPRNYSKEGTFSAIEKDLKRIKELGTTIIYLMPINEIGIKERKGTYGSPYASKDYFSISPDLGTKEDLISLINKTHEYDMKIIVDMVFNHTSPDNVLLKDHEDYYYHKNGKLGNRVGDWSDIIDLDNKKEEVQKYLVSVLKYWASLGFDGFRFDVASMIPFKIFELAREELGKEMIFIGESIDKDFHNYLVSINDNPVDDKDMFPVFDGLYTYNWYKIFRAFLERKAPLEAFIDAFNEEKEILRVISLDNHDIPRIASILNETQLDEYLDFFTFSKGNLFIYAGSEYGNTHLPELFEKDPVDFFYRNKNITEMYKKYINLKKNQKEIKEQLLTKVDNNHVKLKVTYIDDKVEERTFFFSQL